VDLQSLAGNVRVSWQRRASANDFVQRLAWLYSHRLPRRLRPQIWRIGFRYPAPLGLVRLCLRSNHGADAFIHSEVFEQQCYRVPLRRTPATILDLGANIGLSAIFLARLYPDSRLACVEPMADNVRLLRHNLELNGIAADVIAAAVDPADGFITMERGERDYAHRIADAASPQGSLLDVPAVSVPAILRRLGWSRVGLVKMDVEGHEKRLLAQNCEWLDQVDALCLEYHHHQAAQELSRIADRFGFDAPRLLPSNLWLLTRQDCEI
jgi:FkbM family methyltransferase